MAQYFVSANGLDSSPGDQLRPWRTIQKAANTFLPGDTTWIEDGIYNEIVNIARSGAPGQYGYFKAMGANALVDGSGLNPNAGIIKTNYYGGASYLWLEGMKVAHGGNNLDCAGISIWKDSHYITMKNLEVWDIPSSGIMANPNWSKTYGLVSNIFIDGVHVHHTNYLGSQEAISLLAVNGFEVTNSLVHDALGSGLYGPVAKEGIDAKEGCCNGKIRHNEVYNVGGVGVYIDSGDNISDNIDIDANYIHDVEWSAIMLGSEREPHAPVTNCRVRNNIINRCMTGIGLSSHNGGATLYGVEIINNTVVYCTVAGSRSIYIAVPLSQLQNTIIRNNLLVGTDHNKPLIEFQYDDYVRGDKAKVDHNLFYIESGNYNTKITYGEDSVVGNPLLDVNYRPLAGSPAIDAGSDLLAPATDFNEDERQLPIDIGAVEYIEEVIPPPPPPVQSDSVLPAMLGMMALGVIIRSQE